MAITTGAGVDHRLKIRDVAVGTTGEELLTLIREKGFAVGTEGDALFRLSTSGVNLYIRLCAMMYDTLSDTYRAAWEARRGTWCGAKCQSPMAAFVAAELLGWGQGAGGVIAEGEVVLHTLPSNIDVHTGQRATLRVGESVLITYAVEAPCHIGAVSIDGYTIRLKSAVYAAKGTAVRLTVTGRTDT